MRRVTERHSQDGFTLVEMIVSIVIGGILLALVGMFGRWQIQSYLDISSRAALTDAADTALRRMARDIQSALPNSVRVSGNNYLEFIPIRDAGRYRAETDGSGTDFPLDFGISATAKKFDVLGPSVSVAGGANHDHIVVYNLGISGADAYAKDNLRATDVTGAGLSQLSAAAPFAFPLASPANRFHVVGNPVTYECDMANGVIRRHTDYGFLPIQPAAGFSGTSAILVDNVSPAAGCAFTYLPGVLQRNGLVSIRLTLAANGETVTLMHQVELLNTP